MRPRAIMGKINKYWDRPIPIANIYFWNLETYFGPISKLTNFFYFWTNLTPKSQMYYYLYFMDKSCTISSNVLFSLFLNKYWAYICSTYFFNCLYAPKIEKIVFLLRNDIDIIVLYLSGLNMTKDWENNTGSF